MRLADQFWLQDLRSERGLMPIHDVSMCKEDTRSSLPLWCLSSSWFSVCWGHWAGWDFTEPWRFDILDYIRLIGIVAHRMGRQICKTRGERRSRTRRIRASRQTRRLIPDNTQHVVLTRRTSAYFPPTTMNCVFFLALIAYLSWASLGRERVMTSQLFCLSLAFLETYKAGVGTTHTTQTEQDGSEESNARCYTSTLPKARSAAPTFFLSKNTQDNSDDHG